MGSAHNTRQQEENYNPNQKHTGTASQLSSA